MIATSASYLPFGVFFLPHIEKTLHYCGSEGFFILPALKNVKNFRNKKSQAKNRLAFQI